MLMSVVDARTSLLNGGPEGIGDERRRFHRAQCVGQRLGKLLDAEFFDEVIIHFEQVGICLGGQLVLFLDAGHLAHRVHQHFRVDALK